jgi:hypothetical protein
MKITADSRIIASKDQLSSPVDGDTVIAGLRTGNYYGVSGVGARVWQLIQTRTVASEVQRAIATEYDVTPERCEADVLALLALLANEQLIEVEDAPPLP